MAKVVIIEDEPLAAGELETTIKEVDPEIEILAKLDSVKSSIEWLKKNEVDLIFSDIHLGDGKSFEIFDKLNIETPIIFTTAFDKYAIQAFKRNSLDYLLKPIGRKELEYALKQFWNIHKQIKKVDYQSLFTDLKFPVSTKFQERFMVTYGETYLSIGVSEVAYFFSEDRYTYLVSKQDRKHIISYNLTELESRLDPKDFFRINRKFIVSFSSIEKMSAHTKSRVKLQLKPALPYSMEAVVSVEKSGEFKKWLNN